MKLATTLILPYLLAGGALRPDWSLPGSVLDLDFANQRGYNSIDRTKDTPDEILTYTAPSPKWVYNAAGLLVQSSGQLPYDYDPVTHNALGVLIEEQRTNLLTYSEQFDNAVWPKASVTIVVNAAVAPDGTQTADLFYPTTTGTNRRILRNLNTIISGATNPYTQSVYVKSAGKRWVHLNAVDASSGADYCWFDVIDGVKGTVGADATSSIIEDVGNGWFRITVSGVVGLNPYFFLSITDTDGDTAQNVTANGTDGIYVWGAQLEVGAFPTSYIPTVASQVTRAADQVSIATNAFAYNAVAGTVCSHAERNSATIANQWIWSLNDGTANERILNFLANGTLSSFVTDGGVNQVSGLTNGTPSINTFFKAASAWMLNDFAITRDGAAVATDTSLTLPTVTRLAIGMSETNTFQLNGHIKRLTYFPTRKTNSELQALAA